MGYFAVKLIEFNKASQLNINCIITLYVKSYFYYSRCNKSFFETPKNSEHICTEKI